jgi:hypothetical protein
MLRVHAGIYLISCVLVLVVEASGGKIEMCRSAI